jgi:TrpR-related protein YerC/YecD
MKNLNQAILTLRTEEECANFFRDLCTPAEIKAMQERWQVAQLVSKGNSYRKISKDTGVSTATITRVAHWLKNGKGGYRLAIHSLLEETK